MAKHLIFDLEASGLSTQTANILEFAYIIWDDEQSSLEHGRQYFMTDDEVPYGASKVNGLTKARLDVLSSGMYFEDYVDSIKALFATADVIVGHNVISFDMPMLSHSCQRAKNPLNLDSDGNTRMWKMYDTMIHAKEIMPRLPNQRGVYHGPRLTNFYAHVCRTVYKHSTTDLDNMFETTCSTQGAAHEGLYDVWMTYIGYRALLSLRV